MRNVINIAYCKKELNITLSKLYIHINNTFAPNLSENKNLKKTLKKNETGSGSMAWLQG